MTLFKRLGRAFAHAWLAQPVAKSAPPTPRAAAPTGTDRIEAAIDQFKMVADELAAGCIENEQRIADNNALIDRIAEHSAVLHSAARRGRSVEAKIRELIS